MNEPQQTSPSKSFDPTAAPAPPGRELEALGERIAELSAQIQAATYHLLVMLREFDERGGWGCGFRSCAHWLNWRTGLELGAAREKVRVARALAGLPRMAEAMARGEVSFSKVRALTRVATAGNEEELLAFASVGTASHVEKLVRAWRRVDRIEEQEREEQRHAGRYLRLYTDEDGMFVVQARLAPEAGAALSRALDAASERLHGEDRARRLAAGTGAAADCATAAAAAGAATHRGTAGEAGRAGTGVPAGTGETTAEQRRADALGLVAESALAGGLDPGSRGDRYLVVVHVEAEAMASSGAAAAAPTGACGRREDVSAETSLAWDGGAGPRPLLSEPSPAGDGAPPLSLAATRRDVSAETPPASAACPDVSAETPPALTLTGPAALAPTPSGRPPLLPYLADGPHVSAETSRRLACDCSRVVMRHAPDGSVLDVGRRTRTVPPALRRAVAHRDRGCRFPGCGLTLCDHHHIRHWADGGETSLANLTQLCGVHHRAVHEGGFTVERLPDGELRFRRPDGRVLAAAPPLPPVQAASSAALTAHWLHHGIAGDGAASLPSWDGEPLDLEWAVDALRRPSVAS